MREQNRHLERYHTILSWLDRHSIPTGHRQHKFRSTSGIYSNDWRTWIDEYNLATAWTSYRVTVGILSSIAFIYGLGQCILKIRGFR